ncbi:MAG: hypothetical protein RIA64_10455 [Rhodospirillales bacterium]
MRFAFPLAATAVMLSAVVLSPAAYAKDCNADPKAAIKTAEGEFKKVKKGLDKAASKSFVRAMDKAKMALRSKQNDVACASLSDALGFLAPKN